MNQNEQDQQLISELKKGSNEAMNTIYRKYKDYLIIIASNILGSKNEKHGEAIDLLQNVFCRLLTKWPAGNINNLRAFLTECIKNETYNYLKKANRSSRINKTESDLQVTTIQIQKDIICRDQLNRAIEKIPQKRRHIFIEHLINGKNIDTIAQEQQRSRETILTHLKLATADFRKYFKSNGEN